jgi:hypothetical protein
MSYIRQQILEDIESLPEQFQAETLDFIQFLKQKISNKKDISQVEENNGIKISQLMSKIAERGDAFSDIKDPVAWQHKIRQDRPLPGRE